MYSLLPEHDGTLYLNADPSNSNKNSSTVNTKNQYTNRDILTKNILFSILTINMNDDILMPYDQMRDDVGVT